MKRIAKFFTSIGASTCIVVLAAIGSSGIIWWVNESWSTDNRTYLGVLDNLRLARSELLNGYLLTEKHLSGERELADWGVAPTSSRPHGASTMPWRPWSRCGRKADFAMATASSRRA